MFSLSVNTILYITKNTKYKNLNFFLRTNILKESEILLVDLKNTSSDAAMILGAVVTTVSTSPPDISYVTANGGKCKTKGKNQICTLFYVEDFYFDVD